ncbi:YibE/F family protein [Brevibacterium sp. 5221]|uniref:YibE/F family protein n=1 Tax=Brevibacterium rongguiense TaxID=2695267 RepID=A0A6N9HA89_9MICO|nr:YibE/F family protein [Brevibacterium rongguiense]MYM20442.1 YibE/F family protein [Brevibacterium rongguiense]
MHVHSESAAPAPASPTARIVMLALVGLLAAAALTGLIALWPGGDGARAQGGQAQGALSTGVVTAVDAAACADDAGEGCALARARVDGESVRLALPSQAIADLPHVGDRVKVTAGKDAGTAVFVDYDRALPMGLLAALCALAVVGVAFLRGLRALVGLAFAFAVIFGFMLPAMLSGRPALLVGLTAAAAIMVVVMYAAHGFTLRTTAALLGTAAGVAITGALAFVITERAHLSGRFEDDSYVLAAFHHLSSGDVVVCSMLIAGIGVLNDVTITQVAALWELAAAQPRAERRELFAAAMRIGRDHIASSVYTVAFVLAGGALATLLLVSASGRPVLQQLMLGQQSVEIANILVCLIGLVLAVPLTTAIAALAVPRERPAGLREAPARARH